MYHRVFSALGLCAGTHKWKLVLVTSRKYSRHPTCTALIILSYTAYSVKCVTLQGSYCLFRGNSICILENHLLFQTSYRLKHPSINKLANIFMIKKNQTLLITEATNGVYIWSLRGFLINNMKKDLYFPLRYLKG